MHTPKPAENDEEFHASAVTSIARSIDAADLLVMPLTGQASIKLAAYDSGRQIRD